MSFVMMTIRTILIYIYIMYNFIILISIILNLIIIFFAILYILKILDYTLEVLLTLDFVLTRVRLFLIILLDLISRFRLILIRKKIRKLENQFIVFLFITQVGGLK